MKTIKFNLDMNNRMIRSVDEFYEHFNIDDVYELYEANILQKWLRIQGKSELADQLDHIDENRLSDKIMGILSIFGFSVSDAELKTYGYLYKQAYKKRLALSDQQEKMFEKSITFYHEYYVSLKTRLIEFEDFNIQKTWSREGSPTQQTKISTPKTKIMNQLYYENAFNVASVMFDLMKDNMTPEQQGREKKEARRRLEFLKITINEIANTSLELFKLDALNFFNEFIDKKPIIIVCCLMNAELREVIWNQLDVEEKLSRFATDEQMFNRLKPYLYMYQGSTDGRWKDLGEKEKSYLVIHMSSGCRVGEMERPNVEYDHTEIEGEYEIMQGLIFKSTSSIQYVYYLEV